MSHAETAKRQDGSLDTFCCEGAENEKTESKTRRLYNAANLPTAAQ